MTPSTLVVGAGWAGLAAAVGLVEAGHAVRVVDAANRAGGRARRVDVRLGDDAVPVDNGQHLLIGAYRATLALIGRVGVDPAAVLERRRLWMRAPDGFELRTGPGPAPLNLAIGLLRARGLAWRDRAAATRLALGLAAGGAARVPEGTTVADWLAARRQPAGLVARLWEPLCVGALNTPIERACARAFVQVLHDALLSDARASDFLWPRATLSDVLPEPAVAWLRARGAHLRLGLAGRALGRAADGRWRLETAEGTLAADRVVLAVPPGHAARLLAPVVDGARLRALARFEHEPIATVWLGWTVGARLPEIAMLEARAAAGEHGQWLFARAVPAGGTLRALAGVVVSAAGRCVERRDELAQGVARQVAAQLRLPPPAHATAVVDRRATIRCGPDRPRVEADAFADVAPGLALAGDWLWHRYPATIESAVRSGDAAARWIAGGPLERP